MSYGHFHVEKLVGIHDLPMFEGSGYKNASNMKVPGDEI